MSDKLVSFGAVIRIIQDAYDDTIDEGAMAHLITEVNKLAFLKQPMLAVEYAMAKGEMCRSFEHCGSGCPMYEALYAWDGSDTFHCSAFEAERPEEAVAIVEKWKEEHHERSEDNDGL